MRLTRIEVSGGQRFSQNQVLALSGLRVGQTIHVDGLGAAANKLMSSGLFKSVSYHYRTIGVQLEITFQIEEAEWTVPVVFDNFVWFTDEELRDAVREEVPGFDGIAPAGSGVASAISRALQRLLDKRNIQHPVDYLPLSDEHGRNPEHVFSVKGTGLKICSVRFVGASVVPETELLKAAQAIISTDYSRGFVAQFASGTLFQLYRQRGHWRAAFQRPAAKLGDDAGCSNGVAVSLSVDEGIAYLWDKAEWTGNTAMPARELDALLAMKPGEIANGSKVDDGVRIIRKAYLRRGYLGVRVDSEPALDDATHRATFRVGVHEGPQFRMGTISIAGLSDATANRLKSKWVLKPGDVYDEYYSDDFLPAEVANLRRGGATFKTVSVGRTLNTQALTVDVTITFK